jgi:hypothetical protein
MSKYAISVNNMFHKWKTWPIMEEQDHIWQPSDKEGVQWRSKELEWIYVFLASSTNAIKDTKTDEMSSMQSKTKENF